MKKMKIIEFQSENHENHGNLKIHIENHAHHENNMIPFETN